MKETSMINKATKYGIGITILILFLLPIATAGLLTSWTFATVNGNTPSYDSTQHHVAGSSIKIDVPGTVSTKSGYPVSNIITATPSTYYTLNGWGKTLNVGGTINPSIRVIELDSSGNMLVQTSIDFSKGTNDWSERNIQFKTNPSTKTMFLTAGFLNGYGTFWIDDVDLIQSTVTTPWASLSNLWAYIQSLFGKITSIINPQPPAPTYSLIAKWSLDNNANDVTGKYPGTSVGVNYVAGKVGQAGSFTGSNYISATPIPSLSSGTVMAWIKPSGDYSIRQTIAAGFDSVGSDATSRYSLFASTSDCPSGDVSTTIANGAAYQTICSGYIYNSVNFPSNIWVHLTMTYDGSNVNFYKNGVLVASKPQTVSGAGNAQPYSIGRIGAYSALYYKGTIDEVAIYNRALTPAEITKEMAGSTIVTPIITPVATVPTQTPPPSGTGSFKLTPSPFSSSGQSVVKIGSDKVLTINGKKIFPQFFYTICNSGTTSTSQCATNVNNLNMMTGSFDGSIVSANHIPIYTQNKMGFAGMIGSTNLASNPTFIGYMQMDEPNNNAANLATVTSLYNTAHATDPNHPVMITDWRWFKRLQPAGDVLISDFYPKKGGWSLNSMGSFDNLNYFYENILYRDVYEGTPDDLSDPVWNIIQALGSVDDGGALPLTAKEMRTLTYSSITMNTKGLVYWTYSWAPLQSAVLMNSPQYQQIYFPIFKEINMMNDILVLPSKDYSWGYKKGNGIVQLSNNPPKWNGIQQINYMLKEDSTGTNYLIIVNKDVSSITTTITISGINSQGFATEIGLSEAGSTPGRTLPIVNGKFTDILQGQSVHIFKISPV